MSSGLSRQESTERNVNADGAMAVTFTTTAVTPEGGTPPLPSTVMTRVAPWPSGPLPAPVLH